MKRLSKRVKFLMLVAVVALLIPIYSFADDDHNSTVKLGAVLTDNDSGEAGYDTGVVDTGKLGENLNWILYENGCLEVTGGGSTYDYGITDSEGIYREPICNTYGKQITSLALPEGLTKIGRNAFYGLSYVTGNLTLPQSVTSVGISSFGSCGFSDVVLPDRLEDISDTSFYACKDLTSIICSPDNSYYTSIDGVLFNKEVSSLVFYPPGRTEKEYRIPEGVTVINRMNSLNLEKIVFPSTLSTIGEGAFLGCEKLKDVNLDNTMLSTIPMHAFPASVKEISVPERVNKILYQAFCGAKTVYIYNASCSIGYAIASWDTVFYGYKDSTAQSYAERYGFEFRDVLSGDLILSHKGNRELLELLPTTGFKQEPPPNTTGAGIDVTSGEYKSLYLDSRFEEASDSVKEDIKNKTIEICSGLSNDYDKAFTIFKYVYSHMHYKYGLASDLAHIWDNGQGNCAAFALLTGTMLYYANIPNGAIFLEKDHVINIALCEGRWIPIDSQGSFDLDPEEYERFNCIVFQSDHLVFKVEDLTGIKIASIGLSYTQPDEGIEDGINVPDWISGYDPSVCTISFFDEHKKKTGAIEIRGKKDSVAEQMARDRGYQCFVYSDDRFIANKDHVETDACVVTKKASRTEKGIITHYCQRGDTYTETIPQNDATAIVLKNRFYVKASKVKKSKFTIKKPIKIYLSKTKASYKKVNGKGCFSINKTSGNVTVKKGTKRGKYVVKVKVKYKENNLYKAGSETVKLFIIVR